MNHLLSAIHFLLVGGGASAAGEGPGGGGEAGSHSAASGGSSSAQRGGRSSHRSTPRPVSSTAETRGLLQQQGTTTPSSPEGDERARQGGRRSSVSGQGSSASESRREGEASTTAGGSRGPSSEGGADSGSGPSAPDSGTTAEGVAAANAGETSRPPHSTPSSQSPSPRPRSGVVGSASQAASSVEKSVRKDDVTRASGFQKEEERKEENAMLKVVSPEAGRALCQLLCSPSVAASWAQGVVTAQQREAHHQQLTLVAKIVGCLYSCNQHRAWVEDALKKNAEALSRGISYELKLLAESLRTAAADAKSGKKPPLSPHDDIWQRRDLLDPQLAAFNRLCSTLIDVLNQIQAAQKQQGTGETFQSSSRVSRSQHAPADEGSNSRGRGGEVRTQTPSTSPQGGGGPSGSSVDAAALDSRPSSSGSSTGLERDGQLPTGDNQPVASQNTTAESAGVATGPPHTPGTVDTQPSPATPSGRPLRGGADAASSSGGVEVEMTDVTDDRSSGVHRNSLLGDPSQTTPNPTSSSEPPSSATAQPGAVGSTDSLSNSAREGGQGERTGGGGGGGRQTESTGRTSGSDRENQGGEGGMASLEAMAMEAIEALNNVAAPMPTTAATAGVAPGGGGGSSSGGTRFPHPTGSGSGRSSPGGGRIFGERNASAVLAFKKFYDEAGASLIWAQLDDVLSAVEEAYPALANPGTTMKSGAGGEGGTGVRLRGGFNPNGSAGSLLRGTTHGDRGRGGGSGGGGGGGGRRSSSSSSSSSSAAGRRGDNSNSSGAARGGGGGGRSTEEEEDEARRREEEEEDAGGAHRREEEEGELGEGGGGGSRVSTPSPSLLRHGEGGHNSPSTEDDAAPLVLSQLLPILEAFLQVHQMCIAADYGLKDVSELNDLDLFSVAAEAAESEQHLGQQQGGDKSPTTVTTTTIAVSSAGVASSLSRRGAGQEQEASSPSSLRSGEGRRGGGSGGEVQERLHHSSGSAGGGGGGVTISRQHVEVCLFGEKHRACINALIKQTPSLLTGALNPLLKLAPMTISFENKRFYFRHRIRDMRQSARFESIRLSVRRSQVFTDSYHQIRMRSGEH